MTKAISPEVCHIIPFSINNDLSKIDSLGRMQHSMRHWILQPRLLLHTPGCSDNVWNMLCLNRQMHKWWGECLWALKCLGITPDGDEEATISLQFHWMPATSRKSSTGKPWKRPIDLQKGEGREMVEEWKRGFRRSFPGVGSSTVGRLGAVDLTTGRFVQSGHVFELSMEIGDARKMKQMVDLQWAMIQLATMSGAAGDPEFLAESDDEEDGDLIPSRSG